MIFSHPIKGMIRIFKANTKCASHVILVDTKESETLFVPLHKIAKGNWYLVLNWEYDEKPYTYNRSISIT
jgi:hypothetical protein